MPESLNRFHEYLSLAMNIINAVVIAGSVITFFFLMFNKFSKGLKVILAPCGFSLGARLKVFILCRQSPVKKRAFLEYAMLKSQGYALIPAEWNAIINEFKVFYSEEQSKMLYTIPNCTVLIGEEFTNVVQRYFEYFSTEAVKRAFGIQRDHQVSWVLKIRIKEAYATPTCLLTGLLARFEENWEDFIKRYISTAYIADGDDHDYNDILTDELYLMFAWLLWGPSYELKYKSHWKGLCQISYGDECNSIPAVANADLITTLQARFAENRGLQYGVLMSIDVSLYENKAYYRNLRDPANPINHENAYFYDKIQYGSFSFAAQIDNLIVSDDYKAEKYYCTAYVWLLFEMDDDESYAFKPEKSLAFFEHANLSDKKTYTFLTETLIDKSIKHFTTIFSKPELEGRKYRFVCALNEEIAADMQKRYKEIIDSGSEIGKAFAQRIFLEPKRPPTDAFAAYDEYFSATNSISFVEVTRDDKNSVSEFAKFYIDVYMENFPDPDERESFDNILTYLEKAKTAAKYHYHIVLAKDTNGNIVGGGLFNYFVEPNSGVIEFIAVKKSSQSSGIGTIIYNHILTVMSADAHQLRRKKLEYVFCEIDTPNHTQDKAKKYLHFWNKHNFWRLDFSYVQPALSENQKPVEELWFTVSPLLGRIQEINGDLVVSVLSDFLKYAMQIDPPNDDPVFQKMRDEIAGKEVRLLPIIGKE